jgi:hypothetical protein
MIILHFSHVFLHQSRDLRFQDVETMHMYSTSWETTEKLFMVKSKRLEVPI